MSATLPTRSATLQRAFRVQARRLARHTFAEAARYELSLSNFTLPPSNFLPRSATLISPEPGRRERAFRVQARRLARHTFAEAARYELSLPPFPFTLSSF